MPAMPRLGVRERSEARTQRSTVKVQFTDTCARIPMNVVSTQVLAQKSLAMNVEREL